MRGLSPARAISLRVLTPVSVEREIKGTEFANCNCAYGCGCQFNAPPDKGFCEAVAGYQIHRVTLDMSVPMVCAPLPCGGGPARSAAKAKNRYGQERFGNGAERRADGLLQRESRRHDLRVLVAVM